MSMKNPLTLAGIEPATFWFVAQHLNHCATAVRITTTRYYVASSGNFLPTFRDNPSVPNVSKKLPLLDA